MIAIEGSIQTRTYQDKEGNKRKVFEVWANNVHFVESKKEMGNNEAPQRPIVKNTTELSAYSSGDEDDFQTIESDDDLPF